MIKYSLEYPIQSSIKILYARLSTLSGLSEWFANDVNSNREGIYTFTWEGSQQQATLINKKKDSLKIIQQIIIQLFNYTICHLYLMLQNPLQSVQTMQA